MNIWPMTIHCRIPSLWVSRTGKTIPVGKIAGQHSACWDSCGCYWKWTQGNSGEACALYFGRSLVYTVCFCLFIKCRFNIYVSLSETVSPGVRPSLSAIMYLFPLEPFSYRLLSLEWGEYPVIGHQLFPLDQLCPGLCSLHWLSDWLLSLEWLKCRLSSQVGGNNFLSSSNNCFPWRDTVIHCFSWISPCHFIINFFPRLT